MDGDTTTRYLARSRVELQVRTIVVARSLSHARALAARRPVLGLWARAEVGDLHRSWVALGDVPWGTPFGVTLAPIE